MAAVAFSLLTAAVTTSKAATVGVLRSNLRPAYDILVRPPGSRTPIEKSRGLVADNYLSGIYGVQTVVDLRVHDLFMGHSSPGPLAVRRGGSR